MDNTMIFPLKMNLVINRGANLGFLVFPVSEYGITYAVRNINYAEKSMQLDLAVIHVPTKTVVQTLETFNITKSGYVMGLLNKDEFYAAVASKQVAFAGMIDAQMAYETALAYYRATVDDEQANKDAQKTLEAKKDDLDKAVNAYEEIIVPEKQLDIRFTFDQIIQLFDGFKISEMGIQAVGQVPFNGRLLGDYI